MISDTFLPLAAAPVFLAMALLTGLHDGAMPGMLCSQQAWPFAGMIPMYLLMAAFHLGPWLRLLSRSRRGA